MTILVPSFWDESSSFLQATKKYPINAWISLNFGLIPSQTTELAALECLKNQCIML